MIVTNSEDGDTITPGLYLVSTPIGNLADLTFRAVQILRSVDLIAAEDTRHSGRLLSHYSINTPSISFHDHNESAVTPRLLKDLQKGRSIAVISDAGTPLIRDPGYHLVREARAVNINVIPIPGCCAAIAALSASGLATDRFMFVGYPPRTQNARQVFLQQLADDACTVIMYESSHRVRRCLKDISAIYPPSRTVVVAREITKQHESIRSIKVSEIESFFDGNSYADKGEFVIILQGKDSKASNQVLDPKTQDMLSLLLAECSVKTAVDLTTKLSGRSKKLIYQAALEMQKQS